MFDFQNNQKETLQELLAETDNKKLKTLIQKEIYPNLSSEEVSKQDTVARQIVMNEMMSLQFLFGEDIKLEDLETSSQESSSQSESQEEEQEEPVVK